MHNIVPWTISIISLLFVILTYVRNGKTANRDDIRSEDAKFEGIKESLLKLNLKLDQVCTTTNETRSDIKSLNKDMSDLEKRIIILERDMKTAFTILEDIKKGQVKDE